eukprot:305896-Amphidinium_carterae.3
MAKYCEGDEAVIHKEMPDHVRRIMAGKRVRMSEELVVLCGYENKYAILHEMDVTVPQQGGAVEKC